MKIVFLATIAPYTRAWRLPIAVRLRLEGIETGLTWPRGNFRDRRENPGIRWHEPPAERTGLDPIEEAGTEKNLPAPRHGGQRGLLDDSKLRCAARRALAVGVAMVQAVDDPVSGLGHSFRSCRLKAPTLAVQKTCNVYSVRVEWMGQVVVAWA